MGEKNGKRRRTNQVLFGKRVLYFTAQSSSKEPTEDPPRKTPLPRDHYTSENKMALKRINKELKTWVATLQHSAAQVPSGTTYFTGRPPSWARRNRRTRGASFSSPFTFPRTTPSNRPRWRSQHAYTTRT